MPGGDPHDKAGANYEHGPLKAERIPPSQFEPGFLNGLHARREVQAVPENWNGDTGSLRPGVTWVMYPNGDLERVGFA